MSFPRAPVGSRQRVRALGASMLSAALVAGAAPRWNFWPLAFVAVAPLYLAVRRSGPLEASAWGWLTGFCINLYGYGWTIAAMHRFANVPTLPAFGLLGAASAYQAMTCALVFGGASLLERRTNLPWVVSGPLLIVIAENALPFVFPWYLGITLSRAWPLLQVAEIGGPPAVSGWIVLVNITIGDAIRALGRRERFPRPTAISAIVAGCIVLVGLGRAAHVAWATSHSRHVRVGIVQPNFGIVSNLERSRNGQHLADVLRTQTDALAAQDVDLVVWPESSFPFLFDRRLDREFASAHPWALRSAFRGSLLIGALTHDFGASYVYNSAVLVTPEHRIAGRYDKVRLMPFGEYIPFADRYPAWAARMKKRLPESPLITPGVESTVLQSGSIRLAPMICYEDILPESSADIAAHATGANLLVTLVNHAWFGDSLAPSESLALATFRSIELRRALVRAANTGVSSIGDPLGRVMVESPLVAVSNEREAPPLRLQANVPLVEIAAGGPLLTAGFPYLCSLILVLAWLRARQQD